MFRNKFKLFDEVPADGGAGASAPQEPAAPVENFNAPQDVDWGDMASDEMATGGFEEEFDSPSAPDTIQPPTEPQTPAEPQAAEPVQPIQPPEQAPEAQPQQPITPEMVQAAEQAYQGQLEKLYQFDEETALKLQTEPEKILPQLAARLHVEVLKTAMAQLRGVLPGMMDQFTKSTTRETEAKTQFFGAWPELKGYEKQVLEVGKMFRAMNPNADPQTAIQRIGEIAIASLGIQRQQQQAQQTPTRQPSTPAYRPAAPGRTGAPQAQPTLWDEMIEGGD